MKIKLNKEQVSYLNGLDSPEAKKEFLMNCFLHQCEAKLKEEESQPIIFKDGLFKTSDPEIIEWMNNFNKGLVINFDSPKDSSRERFDKFIEDNGLKKFTPPDLKTLKDVDNLIDRFNNKGLNSNNVIIKDGEEYNLSKMSMIELNKFAILEILNDNPSLNDCIDMKNFCAKIGEYELCAKFREKEKQLLDKMPPSGESLSKEQLKEITNPIDDFIKYTVSHLGWNANGTNEVPKGEINLDAFPATDKFFKEVERVAKFYDVKLFQELLDYEPPHPDKVKKYTKEYMERCFNESRRYRIEPPNPRDRFWKTFEEYLDYKKD